MTAKLHLQKLSVGTLNVSDMSEWQAQKRAQTKDGLPRHITRMWPKRENEIVNGGSIYWVIKGSLTCRQEVLRFDEVIGQDGIRRCAFVLDPKLIRVVPTLKRPFQGWRYLNPADAPADLREANQGEEPLPASLSAALAEIGVF